MKKIKIGIPRALLYYRYGVLWKYFFKKLGLNVILSPETNQTILDLGINNSIDESCLSSKIYLGHALYLSKTCDYILVSRVCDYGKKDKVCTRLNGLYDTLKCFVPESMIIDYNIEYTSHAYPIIGFLKMGFRFTKNPLKIIHSYIYALKKQKAYNKTKYQEEQNKLFKPQKKILIFSQFYNIKDKFISSYIINYLETSNIIPIIPSHLSSKLALSFSDYFSDTLYWHYSKELVGSLYYYSHQIDGIIYLSTYPCGLSALVNNLAISKYPNIPSINLLIDENITNLSLETKLESFIDIINGGLNE